MYKTTLTILIFFIIASCVDEGTMLPEKANHWKFLTKNTNGLAGDLITTLYTDSKGNVWVGTATGLSKYDGSAFTNYSVTAGPLTHNWILSIIEDRDGNLIVGTRNGLNLFDGEQWYYFQLFVGVEVTALVEASNGDVWVGTSGYGVVQLFYAGGYAQHLDNNCVDCNYINALHRRGNVLWIGSESDVKRYANNLFQSFTENDGLSSSWISAIGSDNWGNTWFGAFDNPVIVRYRDGNFDLIPLSHSTAFNWVRAIVEDRNGTLWVAADGGGLNYFDGSVMQKIYGVFDDEYVTALTVDSKGVLWVGTEGAGLATIFKNNN
jgi:ligand-binding sensor domain-containing protein